MKAEELRIWNLVEFEGCIFQIYSLDPELPNLNTCEFGIGIVDYNNINPIPITEEWLVRFGFEIKEKNYSLNAGGELYKYAVNDRLLIFGDERGWCINEMPRDKQHFIKYVHELQNLYYALTGEELI